MTGEAEPLAAQRRVRMLAALARPVRHDLNNQLHVILGNADLLRRDAPADAALRRIDRIAAAAEQILAATGAMLALTAESEAPTVPGDALDAIAPLLRLLLPPGRLRHEPFGGRWAVGCPQAALQDAVLALAADIAAHDRAGGLTITVRQLHEPGGAELVELSLGLAAVAPALALLEPVAVLCGGLVTAAAEGVVLLAPRIA